MFIIGAAYSQNCDDVQYYIKGELKQYTENNQRRYKLYNIESKGIFFEKKDTMIGVEDKESGSQRFVFDRANTIYPGGPKSFSQLRYWRWDESMNNGAGGWQEDVENLKATAAFRTDKVMTIMIVLDCSNSLTAPLKSKVDQFSEMKKAAISFIEGLSSASGEGNIHVGIRGFNAMVKANEMVYDIKPLTETTKTEMVNFINGMKAYNNTALYHAMDNAVKMIENHVYEANIDDEDYFGTMIMTFTDGFDNDSYDASLGDMGEKRDDPYYKHVEKLMRTKTIKSQPVESFVVGLNSSGLNPKDFEEVLVGLSTDKDHFSLITEATALLGVFRKISQNITDRWLNLTCYVPSGRSSIVRWTLGELQKPPKPKKQRNILAGFNLGVGGTFTKPYKELKGSFGFDFMGGGPKFGMGFYLSYTTYVDFGGGLLFRHPFKSQKGAIFWGLGADFDICSDRSYPELEDDGVIFFRYLYSSFIHGNFRIGMETNSPWYFFVNLGLGSIYVDDGVNGSYIRTTFSGIKPTLTFHVGYNMAKNKKNKNKK